MKDFKWIDWNVDHIARHGIWPEEAEWVVEQARQPYPERIGAYKYRIRGQSEAGAYLEVLYTIDPDDRIFVITARPLSERERRQFRRRRK